MSEKAINIPSSWWSRTRLKISRFLDKLAFFFSRTVNLENWIRHDCTHSIEVHFNSLSPRSQFKSLLAAFKNYKAQDFCDLICKHCDPQQVAFCLFSKLTPHQKIQLLSEPALDKKTPLTVLGFLLWEADKNKWIIKFLMQDLSSQQRIHLLTELYNFSPVLDGPQMTPEVLAILFEGATPHDRMRFLATLKHNRSILMHIAGATQKSVSDNSKIQTQKIEILEFLFKDLTPEEIHSLLDYKIHLSSEALAWQGFDASFTPEKGISVMDIAQHDHHSHMVRFLNQFHFKAREEAVRAANFEEGMSYKRLR